MCTTSCCEIDRHHPREPVSERTRWWADVVIATWIVAHVGAGVAAAVLGAWMPAFLLLGSGVCAAAFFGLLPEPTCWLVSVATITLFDLAIVLPWL